MSSRSFDLVIATIGLTTFALASGCACSPDAMTPPLQRFAHTQSGSVSVTAVGGSATNQFWSALIDTQNFAKAVEQSIDKSGIFESVQDNHSSEYHLEANLRAMDNGPKNSDVKFRMLISWKLTKSAGNRVIWEADIVSTTEKNIADVAQENIRQALASLEAAVPVS